MGFGAQINALLRHMPEPSRQTLLFSATMPAQVCVFVCARAQGMCVGVEWVGVGIEPCGRNGCSIDKHCHFCLVMFSKYMVVGVS
jgi:hypothetical protein